MLDALMPEKLEIKEAPASVEDAAPAAGSKAAPCLSAARTTALVKPRALDGATPAWRGACPICLDLVPINLGRRTFYECCCRSLCTDCHVKCKEYDTRCPLCRTPAQTDAERLRLLQKHVDEGNAEAQLQLGDKYCHGGLGLKKNSKRALQLYEAAAAQGHAHGQAYVGQCYDHGDGVKVNYTAAALWYRRAAEQGLPIAQYNLGVAFAIGQGVAQSDDEAVRWFRLAAAQGDADALYSLGVCHAKGDGVAQDLDEALRFFKRAAAKGHAEAAAAVETWRKG
jgi:TPR repeat protein